MHNQPNTHKSMWKTPLALILIFLVDKPKDFFFKFWFLEEIIIVCVTQAMYSSEQISTVYES